MLNNINYGLSKELENEIEYSGFQWNLKRKMLQDLRRSQDAFTIMMDSKMFTEEEKEYILFNISQIQDISYMNYSQFQKEVKNFKESINA